MTAGTLAILAVAPLFLVVCIAGRELALAVFCALLPAYLVRFAVPLPFVGALPSTLLEVLFAELFLSWLLLDAKNADAWRPIGEWAEPLLLLFLGATVGVLISPDLRGALGLWRAYIVEPFLFLPLFVDIVVRKRRGALVLAGLGACLAVVGMSAIFQKATGYGIPNPVWQAAATRRVTSFYGFPNAVGLFAAPVVVLMCAWAVALFRDPKRRAYSPLALAAALLGAAAIVFASSKGAMLGVAAGLLVLGLSDARLRAATLIAVIAACVFVVAYPPALSRASVLVSLRDSSGSVRSIIWRETLTMLSDDPVFGAGLSGYRGRIAPYHTEDYIEIFMYPHDVFLNFWSETGLIGLAGFLWLAIKFFLDAVRLARKGAGGWIVTASAAAMAAMLVHGLVDVPYFKNDLAFLFFAVVGMLECGRAIASSKVEQVKEALHLARSPWAE